MAKKPTIDMDLVTAMREQITANDDGVLVVQPDAYFAEMTDEAIEAYKKGVDTVNGVDKIRTPALATAMGIQLINHQLEGGDDEKPQTELSAVLYGGRKLSIGIAKDTRDDGQPGYTASVGLDQPKPLGKGLSEAIKMINNWDE